MTTTTQLPNWRIWILAARPQTLIASLSPVILGSALAAKKQSFHLPLFLCILLAALGIQIGTNLANDYFDFLKGADTPQRKGPIRVSQAGLLSLAKVKKGFIIAFSLSALLSFYLILKGGFVIAALACVSILCGIIYTAGPYSIAYLGLGECFVFFFFGPLATAFTAFLQMGYFSLQGFVLGVAPGALSCCILIVNNLRDVEEDLLANKKTLVVRFGTLFGKGEYLFFQCLAATSLFYFQNTSPSFIIAFLLLSFLVTFPLFQKSAPPAYNALLKRNALFLAIYTILGSLMVFV